MKLQQDFHIHTHCSCDSACAQIADIVRGCQKAGFRHFGIADHLHTQFNLPDLEIARREFLEYGPVPGFHFGVEVTCATAWECEKIAKRDFASCFTYQLKGRPFQTMTPIDGIMYGGPANGPLAVDLTEEDIRRLGIEYVIGGVHKPNYTEQAPRPMIDDYFNQSCFLLNHPLVDILAHPWNGLPFWSSYFIVTRDPADLDQTIFLQIPQEYWDEMAHLLVANKKIAELNFCNIFFKDPEMARFLMEKMVQWKEKGVKFSFATDLHGASYPDTAEASRILTEYGFTEEDFVLPPRLEV